MQKKWNSWKIGTSRAKQSEIEGMLGEGEPGRVTVGESVEDADLISRPDRHARSESADDPLDVLALEQEGVVLLVVRIFGVVLEAVPLRPRHIEAVLEGAIEQGDRNAVDDEKPEDPAPGQGLHDLDIREHEHRIRDRRRGEDEVPREKIAGEPFQEGERARRQHKDGSNGESGARRPVSSLVPCAKLKVVHETLPREFRRLPRPARCLEIRLERRAAPRT